jgi:tetratricopeptide (TPR) repeat protein
LKGALLTQKHLTRKEIVQQDRIELALSGIFNWCSENRALLLILLAVFVLTIAGSSTWRYYQGQSSQELQIQFRDTLDLYHAPVGTADEQPLPENTAVIDYRFESDQERLEESLAAFSRIADDSPSSQLGLLSRYYTGLIKQEMGQIQEAEIDLDFVIQNSPNPEIQNLARNYLARIAQSQNDREKATALLEQILVDESNTFPKAVVLLELAQTNEVAGNAEEALRYYRRLTTEYPTSQHIQQARTHIDQLELLSGQN